MSSKRLGIFAAGILSAAGLGLAAAPAHAAPLPFPPGANFEIVWGYQVAAALVPNNAQCTNTATNTWSVDWTFTSHSWAPQFITTITGVSSAVSSGDLVAPTSKSVPVTTATSFARDLVFSGHATYTGTTDVVQTVNYTTLVRSAAHPDTNGIDTVSQVTLHSPCAPTGTGANQLPRIPGASRFVPLSPDRMFDTRGGSKVAAGSTITVPVLNRNGVPASGVNAVVLNVTATQSTDGGFVTVWPTGRAMPNASNLNLDRANQTTPNLVTVPVGSDGTVSVFTSGGAHIIVDVMGYYEATDVAVKAGRFVALPPDRVADTRGNSTIAAGGNLTVPVAGRNGVPSSGADAVVLNVTATGALRGGFVTVYPTGQTVPQSSNLNIDHAGETRANQVIVKLGDGGAISLFSDGGTDILVDVAGYFTSAAAGLSQSGLFVPVTPGRALDTRGGPKPVAGETLLPVLAALVPGVPSGEVGAVALNVTAVDATTQDFVTVWPEGSALPNVSNINLDKAGQTVPNHVTTLVGSQGEVSVFTHGGAHVLVDVLGFYTSGLVMAKH